QAVDRPAVKGSRTDSGIFPDGCGGGGVGMAPGDRIRSVRAGGGAVPVEALEEASLIAVAGAGQPLALDHVRQPGAERAQGAEGLHQEPLGLVRLSERSQEPVSDAHEAWKLHASHLNHTAWPVDNGSDSWGSD